MEEWPFLGGGSLECRKLIFKLHSGQIKNANLDMDLYWAMENAPENIVALNDSQVLRWIDELHGVEDVGEKVVQVQRRIRAEKRKPRTRETKAVIRKLYQTLYDLQFQKDYISIVMDSERDYDRINEGFTVNGVKFRRLLGTSGGIKNSTIIYINEELYPEIKRRMDNGRNPDKPLVPAKLEAYYALICSGSTPLPPPCGVIVVKDCFTKFIEDVVVINDEAEGEPVLSFEKQYEIEHDATDGFGLMSPEYSERLASFFGSSAISGFNSRYAWCKGMVYTFPFVEFARDVAGSYTVIDAWGEPRDVREADLILTESMVKLWDSYESWEDYKRNCDLNHYVFSAAKTTPDELENVRDTNYQFLADIDLDDDDIGALCKPTFDEINDVLGMDYRKALAFMTGFSLTEENVRLHKYSPPIQALMIEPDMIKDSFIRKKIWNMISRRIEMAKRGAIRIAGNYAMISGDPYLLCQSMFGLNTTGLLKSQEVYHKYWIDKGAYEILCFRAPMTSKSNIRKLRLNRSDEAAHWFRYMETVCILNGFDSTCESTNGADFDGDTYMCTDDPILLRKVENQPTIICVQRKADKKVVTEADIIQANKLGFNDDIGIVTNHVTSMIERRAGFPQDSEEYKTLSYRIMCGQAFQQETIDRIKGVVCEPMPSYWYSYRDVQKLPESKFKNICEKICASNKPYFMKYVYPALKTKHNEYVRNNDFKAARLFTEQNIHGVRDLLQLQERTEEMNTFLEHYKRHMVVGENPCVINRMCWMAENEFPGLSKPTSLSEPSLPDFDYNILRCGTEYSSQAYNDVYLVYSDFQKKYERKLSQLYYEKSENDIDFEDKYMFMEHFKRRCAEVCPDENELCDILIDICYQAERRKAFVWEICGDTMVRNLLRRHDYKYNLPVVVDDGEFTYGGRDMEMRVKYDEHDTE